MRIKPLQPTPYSLRVRCGFQARLRGGVTRGSRLAARGDEEVSMSFTTEDIIRPEVGFLLRGDYRGKVLCLPCLVTLIRERLGTNLSTSKIERALDAVFKSPGALTRLPSFLCDLCQTMMPCLGEARSRDSAVHLA